VLSLAPQEYREANPLSLDLRAVHEYN